MPRQLAPITLPTFPEKGPLAPLMNFAIVSNDLKNYYFNLYSLQVFRCTGTLTDRGKHRSLNTSILALSPTCHRNRVGLSPIRPFGDTVVTCSPKVSGKFPQRSPTAVRHGRTCRVPNGGLPAAMLLCTAGGQHSKSGRAAKPPAAVWQRSGSSCTAVRAFYPTSISNRHGGLPCGSGSGRRR